MRESIERARSIGDRPVALGLIVGALCSPVALGISTTPTALQAAARDLKLSSAADAWLLIGYALAQAVAVPLCGRLGDTRGLRETMLWAPVAMFIGAAGVSLSNTFVIVLLGRLAEGAAGGAFTVAAIGVVAARAVPAKRAHALGTMTAVIGLVSGAGTWIGGVVVVALSWRGVFALPALSLVAWAGCVRLLPNAGESTREGVDVIGAVLVAVTVAIATCLLESPGTNAAVWLIVSLVIGGSLSLAALRASMRRRPTGFLPYALVRNRGFVVVSIAAMTVCSGYVALLFAIPQLLSEHNDWTQPQVGLALLPAAPAGALSAYVIGRLRATVDDIHLAALLACISASGVVMAAAGGGGDVASVIGLALVLAAQTGTNVALVSRVVRIVPPGIRYLAVGVCTLAFQIGGPIGTAVVAGLEQSLGTAGALASVASLPIAGAALLLYSRGWIRAHAGAA